MNSHHIFHQPHLSPTTAFIHHIFHPPNFSRTIFFTHHIFHPPYFSPTTSFTYHSFHPPYFSPTTSFTHHIFHSPYFSPTTSLTHHIYTIKFLNEDPSLYLLLATTPPTPLQGHPRRSEGGCILGVDGLCSQRGSYCYHYTALLRQSIEQFNSRWKYMWGKQKLAFLELSSVT